MPPKPISERVAQFVAWEATRHPRQRRQKPPRIYVSENAARRVEALRVDADTVINVWLNLAGAP